MMRRLYLVVANLLLLHIQMFQCIGSGGGGDTTMLYGSGDLLAVDDTEVGSGILPSRSTPATDTSTKSNHIVINVSDDEDEAKALSGSGDDAIKTTTTTTNTSPTPTTVKQLDEIGGSGNGNYDDEDNNPNQLVTTTRRTPDGAVCTDHYCWCVDENDVMIPDTRKFDPDRSSFTCPKADPSTTTTTVAPSPSSKSEILVVAPDNRPDDIIIDEEKTPKVEILPSTTSTAAPVNIVTATMFDKGKDDIIPKSDDNDKTSKPGSSGDKSSLYGPGAKEEPILSTSTLLAHPGILAAIIGGGIVGLLSALLLFMFIIYRMRKKDEGSYPLDPDSKPPRLHTYTRAPNQEYYA